MSNIDKQVLIAKIKKQTESFDTVVLKEDEANALLDELEAKDQRNAELEDLLEAEIKSWMQRYDSANNRREAAEKRIAELEAKKVTIKLPKSFYPDADIDRPLVINEYQIIEAIVAADCKPIAVCPRCKRELDLTHKPDGAHYCHVADTAEGE